MPILTVDEVIYRRLPAFVIATVDKFAGLPWLAEAGAFFGMWTEKISGLLRRRRSNWSWPEARTQYHRRPALATVRGRPATPAERDAITFKAIPIGIQWSDEEWERAHLTRVRVAAKLVTFTPEELQGALGKLASAGHAPETVNGLIATKEHLSGMIRLLEMAIARSFLVLERLGYDPDTNPPPDYRNG